MEERILYRIHVEEKTCRSCGKTKPASEYWPNPKNIDNLVSYCKQCNVDRAKLWHKKHPEAQQEYNRSSARARIAEEKGDPSQFTKDGVLDRATCSYCGTEFKYIKRRVKRVYCTVTCRNRASRQRVIAKQTQEKKELVSA